MSRLAGKIAIVTGGSQGIGRACSLALAKDGATVIVNYSRSQGPAEEVVSEINNLTSDDESASGGAIAIKADVSSISAIRQLVAEVVKKYGRIDILVCNAGKLYGNATLENTTEDTFDEAFNLNVKGVYFLIQEAAPHFPSGGRIMLFSSSLTAVSSVQPGYLLYNATKGAIEQMTRVLAKDLGRRRITVNTISPGPTATDAFYVGKNDQIVDALRKVSPMNRLGEPEDIASVVAFIASPDAEWISGQNIRINGGMTVG